MNQPENTTPTGSASTTHGTQPYPSPAESGVSPAPTAGADRRGSPASSPRSQLPEALPLLTHAQHLVSLVESGTATFRSETGYRLKDHPQWCTFYSAVKLEERNIATRSEEIAPVTATASPVTDEMVNRFLSWRLPATFSPDGDVSFDGQLHDPQSHWWPVGTNLFNADEARAMLAHVLAPATANPYQAFEPTTLDPSPSDKVETIQSGLKHRGGVATGAFGVQIPHGENTEKLERHAVVVACKGETRASYVAKLRLLADNVEAGRGATYGENQLTGNECNAAEFAGKIVSEPDSWPIPAPGVPTPSQAAIGRNLHELAHETGVRVSDILRDNLQPKTEAPVAIGEGLARYRFGQANPVIFVADKSGKWCIHEEAERIIAGIKAEAVHKEDVARRIISDYDTELGKLRAEVTRLNANPVDDSMRERATAWDSVWSALHGHLRPEYDAVCDCHNTGQAIAVAIIKRAASIIEAQQKTIAEMPTRYRMGVDVAASGSDMSVETTFRQDADGKFQFVGCRVLEPTKPAEWQPKVGDEVVSRRGGLSGKIVWFTPIGRVVIDYVGHEVAMELKDLMPKP